MEKQEMEIEKQMETEIVLISFHFQDTSTIPPKSRDSMT